MTKRDDKSLSRPPSSDFGCFLLVGAFVAWCIIATIFALWFVNL